MRFEHEEIERDFSQEELYGSDELPLHIRCELCDEAIYVDEVYHTDISGNRYCTIKCLLKSNEVEKKIRKYSWKKVTEEDCL